MAGLIFAHTGLPNKSLEQSAAQTAKRYSSVPMNCCRISDSARLLNSMLWFLGAIHVTVDTVEVTWKSNLGSVRNVRIIWQGRD